VVQYLQITGSVLHIVNLFTNDYTQKIEMTQVDERFLESSRWPDWNGLWPVGHQLDNTNLSDYQS